MSLKQDKRKTEPKEQPFVFRARNSYRTEKRLWEFKDSEGKELGK